MAKKAKSADETDQGGNGAEAGGETIAGYFRKVFKENPRLLKDRSNEPLFQRWLADHPGHNEVPDRVRTGLQNIKSVLRREKGKKGGKKPQPAEAGQAQPAQRQARPQVKGLDRLEEQIDECLALAKHLDREALDDVIHLLRRARNEVVRRG